jgi:hypothetical protein
VWGIAAETVSIQNMFHYLHHWPGKIGNHQKRKTLQEIFHMIEYTNELLLVWTGIFVGATFRKLSTVILIVIPLYWVISYLMYISK